MFPQTLPEYLALTNREPDFVGSSTECWLFNDSDNQYVIKHCNVKCWLNTQEGRTKPLPFCPILDYVTADNDVLYIQPFASIVDAYTSSITHIKQAYALYKLGLTNGIYDLRPQNMGVLNNQVVIIDSEFLDIDNDLEKELAEYWQYFLSIAGIDNTLNRGEND